MPMIMDSYELRSEGLMHPGTVHAMVPSVKCTQQLPSVTQQRRSIVQ